MISRLTGKIAYIGHKYIVIDVNGVGYKVFSTPDNLLSLKSGKETTFWIYTAVKENAIELYGFPSIKELEMFELLITVSGIGPKTALGVLGVTSSEALETAISSGDSSHLIKVSGIGKKVAEKIVMELKDKLETLPDHKGASISMSSDADAIEALKALGYSQNESRDALKKVSKDFSSTNDKIREALKILGK